MKRVLCARNLLLRAVYLLPSMVGRNLCCAVSVGELNGAM